MEAVPKVSILTLTCDRPQLLSRAIESGLRQTFTDWEWIVVHDGGHEPTAEVMNEWRRRDPRIRYFARSKLTGNIGEAANFGVSNAAGEYIAILDDDDYWAAPGKLAMQADFLDKHRDHAGCGGGAIVVDGSGAEQFRYLRPQHHDEIRRAALLINPMINSTTLFRRDAAMFIGLYDVEMPGYQDWDFWLRIARVGKLHNLPEYLTYYSLWEGGSSYVKQRRDARSAVQIVWRHKANYGRFPLALAMASAQCAYAYLPGPIKSVSHHMLSGVKKRLFSPKPRVA